jgi:hypothetical protein
MADTSHNWLAAIARIVPGEIAAGRRALLAVFGRAARPERVVRAEPLRLSIADQWARLSAIVMGAAEQAQEAARCHASATVQLDLAQYGLISLVDELADVMDMGGRRRRATVHVLGTASAYTRRPLDGAIAA